MFDYTMNHMYEFGDFYFFLSFQATKNLQIFLKKNSLFHFLMIYCQYIKGSHGKDEYFRRLVVGIILLIKKLMNNNIYQIFDKMGQTNISLNL